MNDEPIDVNRALMVDGNAVAGLLHEIFALEMTTSPTECVHCGRTGALGRLVGTALVLIDAGAGLLVLGAALLTDMTSLALFWRSERQARHLR